jgi:VIT1/CCC1 family predicted Fe2+/Mn2+ transporter
MAGVGYRASGVPRLQHWAQGRLKGRFMVAHHKERHRLENIGWLRAAVLGANDGIVSTACLILGVAAAHAVRHGILAAGLSGLVAGAMSMATGEYVSVHSQADTEKAALETERAELASDYKSEQRELTGIYIRRGLEPALARQVAEQLMAHDALEAHARDELGLTDVATARPLQAALASAASFSVGAALPLLVAVLSPLSRLIPAVAIASLLFLALLGAAGAYMGGASMTKGVIRVAFWSSLSMAVTTGIGALFGTVAS